MVSTLCLYAVSLPSSSLASPPAMLRALGLRIERAFLVMLAILLLVTSVFFHLSDHYHRLVYSVPISYPACWTLSVFVAIGRVLSHR